MIIFHSYYLPSYLGLSMLSQCIFESPYSASYFSFCTSVIFFHCHPFFFPFASCSFLYVVDYSRLLAQLISISSGLVSLILSLKHLVYSFFPIQCFFGNGVSLSGLSVLGKVMCSFGSCFFPSLLHLVCSVAM